MNALGVPSPELLRRRAELVRAVRAWLWDHGFVEVEVPVLVRSPALEEHLEALQVADQGFLHTSPEFALKRVLASGLGRIFSITPCFRGEEWGPLHATEFTMLEWYRVGTDYRGILDDCEALVAACAETLGVDFPRPRRVTVAALWRELVDQPMPEDSDEMLRVWVTQVEPRLQEPTFVLDYPADQSAFAVVRGDIAERFELYWRGVELANAFTELLDPRELVERWTHSNEARRAAGREPHPIDQRLVEAVGRHPHAGGIALGVDRLAMLLLGVDDIRKLRVQG